MGLNKQPEYKKKKIDINVQNCPYDEFLYMGTSMELNEFINKCNNLNLKKNKKVKIKNEQ